LKETTENKEIEKAKDHYKTRNEEIEELIQSVLNGFKKGEDTGSIP
jgi:hypothetical protein